MSFLSGPAVAAILLLLCVTFIIYQIYFHPLAHIPGPFLHKISRLPWVFRFTTQNEHEWLHLQYQKYGSKLIRIAPDTVAFCDASFLPLVYHRTADRSNSASISKIWGIMGIQDHQTHAIERRKFQTPFLPVSVAKMQPIVAAGVEAWISALERRQSEIVDMALWTTYLTYDVMTELCLGKSIGFTEKGRDDIGWLEEFEKGFTVTGLMTRLPWLMDLLWHLGAEHLMGLNENGKGGFGAMMKIRTRLLNERMEKQTDKPDILAYMLKQYHAGEMTYEMLKTNLFLILIAGSDTSATILRELLARIASTPSISSNLYTPTGQLNDDYLSACIRETLRFFPPVNNPLPRLVAKGGVHLSNTFIPGGTEIYADAWNIARDTSIYGADAREWKPERFLGLGKEENMKFQKASFVWGYGPMSCPGRPLAEMEIMCAMKRFLEVFEVERQVESYPGFVHKGFMIHNPILIRLKKRETGQ